MAWLRGWFSLYASWGNTTALVVRHMLTYIMLLSELTFQGHWTALVGGHKLTERRLRPFLRPATGSWAPIPDNPFPFRSPKYQNILHLILDSQTIHSLSGAQNMKYIHWLPTPRQCIPYPEPKIWKHSPPDSRLQDNLFLIRSPKCENILHQILGFQTTCSLSRAQNMKTFSTGSQTTYSLFGAQNMKTFSTCYWAPRNLFLIQSQKKRKTFSTWLLAPRQPIPFPEPKIWKHSPPVSRLPDKAILIRSPNYENLLHLILDSPTTHFLSGAQNVKTFSTFFQDPWLKVPQLFTISRNFQ